MFSFAKLTGPLALGVVAMMVGILAALLLSQGEGGASSADESNPETDQSAQTPRVPELEDSAFPSLSASIQSGGAPQMDSDPMDLGAFMHHVSDALGRSIEEDRALFLSTTDPVALIDRLYELRFHRQSGPSHLSDAGLPAGLAQGQPHLPGNWSGSSRRLDAIPPVLNIHVQADLHPSEPLVLRWFNTNTGQTDDMDLVYPSLDLDGSRINTRPKGIGGLTGAWRVEIYQLDGESLNPVANVPVEAGSGEYHATARQN